MAILASLAVPALTGLVKEGNVNQVVNGISTSLNQARAFAMAHNTYVWVGFAQDTTTHKLTVGMVAGTTGQASDLSAASTYAPIAKLQTFQNSSLSKTLTVSGMWQNGVDISSSSISGFQQMGGGNTIAFTSGNVLQFSPQGEASLGSTGSIPHWIQIGLQPIQGSNTSDPNVAVFQVGTLTGQVEVFRP